jgi:hypothetical protein
MNMANGREKGQPAFYPYKTNIRFPIPGIYTFTIEQAMWIRDLKNISNIGLMIEKAGKSK